jgi:hypothetical protein
MYVNAAMIFIQHIFGSAVLQSHCLFIDHSFIAIAKDS